MMYNHYNMDFCFDNYNSKPHKKHKLKPAKIQKYKYQKNCARLISKQKLSRTSKCDEFTNSINEYDTDYEILTNSYCEYYPWVYDPLEYYKILSDDSWCNEYRLMSTASNLDQKLDSKINEIHKSSHILSANEKKILLSRFEKKCKRIMCKKKINKLLMLEMFCLHICINFNMKVFGDALCSIFSGIECDSMDFIVEDNYDKMKFVKWMRSVFGECFECVDDCYTLIINEVSIKFIFHRFPMYEFIEHIMYFGTKNINNNRSKFCELQLFCAEDVEEKSNTKIDDIKNKNIIQKIKNNLNNKTLTIQKYSTTCNYIFSDKMCLLSYCHDMLSKGYTIIDLYQIFPGLSAVMFNIYFKKKFIGIIEDFMLRDMVLIVAEYLVDQIIEPTETCRKCGEFLDETKDDNPYIKPLVTKIDDMYCYHGLNGSKEWTEEYDNKFIFHAQCFEQAVGGIGGEYGNGKCKLCDSYFI